MLCINTRLYWSHGCNRCYRSLGYWSDWPDWAYWCDWRNGRYRPLGYWPDWSDRTFRYRTDWSHRPHRS